MGTEPLSALAIGGGGYEYSAARGIFAIAAGWLAESAVIRFHMILASPRTAFCLLQSLGLRFTITDGKCGFWTDCAKCRPVSWLSLMLSTRLGGA